MLCLLDRARHRACGASGLQKWGQHLLGLAIPLTPSGGVVSSQFYWERRFDSEGAKDSLTVPKLLLKFMCESRPPPAQQCTQTDLSAPAARVPDGVLPPRPLDGSLGLRARGWSGPAGAQQPREPGSGWEPRGLLGGHPSLDLQGLSVRRKKRVA